MCVQKCTIKQKTSFASQRVYVCYTCRRTHRNRCCVELSKICFFCHHAPWSYHWHLKWGLQNSEFRIRAIKYSFPFQFLQFTFSRKWPNHWQQQSCASLFRMPMVGLLQVLSQPGEVSLLKWTFPIDSNQVWNQPQKRTEASPVLSASIPCTLYLKMEQVNVSESTDFEQTTPNNHFRSSARAASSFGGLTASCPRWNRERWRTSFHISVHTDLEL